MASSAFPVPTTPWHTTLAALGVLLLVGACATESPAGPTSEADTPRGCENGRDDDGDGLVDCADPDCATAPLCVSLGDVSAPDASSDPPPDSPQDPDTFSPDADDIGNVDGSDASDDPEGDATDTSDATDTPDSTDAGDTLPDAVEPDTLPDTPADIVPDVPVDPSDPPTRDCLTRLQHRVAGSPASVTVAGPFNGWSPTATPLTGPGPGGNWEVSLDLPPGEHPYKFVVDGVWDFDGQTEINRNTAPVSFLTQWDGGFENRNVRVGDCQRPRLQTLEARGGTNGVFARIQVERGADGTPIDASSIQVTAARAPVPHTFDANTGLLTVEVDDLPSGKHSLRVTLTDEADRTPEESPHFLPLWVEDTPFVWQDATMYFVFTDRFRNGDAGETTPLNTPIPDVPTIANYQGGDFLGVLDAMREGWFDDLGANLLWLSPLTDNPESGYLASDRIHGFSGFHGYWPVSARRIENRFGDVDASASDRLHELIAESHARGIRVMFDIALNHVHEDHDYVREHPEWFTAPVCNCTTDPGPCNWDTNPLFCWFIDYLPDLNYRNHAIVERVSQDIEWLVTEYDVDSFRIDAAKHMDHVIMQRVALRLQERFEAGGGAQIYLVGETYTGDNGHGLIMQYVNPWELDGQFDFPLLYGILDSFFGNGSFRGLATSRANSERLYGDAYPWMSPFLGNHDIPRAAQRIWDQGRGIDPWADVADPMAAGLNDGTWNIINRMSLGFAFVLTQPGIPLIYYGDEIGLYGGADPDNRRPMRWGAQLNQAHLTLLGRVRAIGQARRDHLALRRGTFRELWVDDDLLIYARTLGGGDTVLVAMNKGAARAQVLPIPPDLGLEGVRLTDVLNSSTPRSVQVTGNNTTVTLNPWEYVILAR